MFDTVTRDPWADLAAIEYWLQVSSYCDRWCECCRYGDRCPAAGAPLDDLVSAIDRAGDDPEARAAEARGAEEEAREVLEAEGLTDVHVSVSATPDLRGDPLLRRVKAWSERVGSWLETLAAGPDSEKLRDVLGWYALLVPNKIARCIIGLHFLETCEHCRAAGNKDPQGSAKVAALALHVSIGFLSRWCEARPMDVRAMETLMETCELLEAIKARVPDHMSFRRPGFDD